MAKNTKGRKKIPLSEFVPGSVVDRLPNKLPSPKNMVQGFDPRKLDPRKLATRKLPPVPPKRTGTTKKELPPTISSTTMPKNTSDIIQELVALLYTDTPASSNPTAANFELSPADKQKFFDNFGVDFDRIGMPQDQGGLSKAEEADLLIKLISAIEEDVRNNKFDPQHTNQIMQLLTIAKNQVDEYIAELGQAEAATQAEAAAAQADIELTGAEEAFIEAKDDLALAQSKQIASKGWFDEAVSYSVAAIESDLAEVSEKHATEEKQTTQLKSASDAAQKEYIAARDSRGGSLEDERNRSMDTYKSYLESARELAKVEKVRNELATELTNAADLQNLSSEKLLLKSDTVASIGDQSITDAHNDFIQDSREASQSLQKYNSAAVALDAAQARYSDAEFNVVDLNSRPFATGDPQPTAAPGTSPHVQSPNRTATATFQQAIASETAAAI